MDEQEWLRGSDLEAMLRHLNGMVSERKFRLTECAFMRRFWHLLTDERSRRALEVAERFADGESNRNELREAYALAEAAFDDLRHAYFPAGPIERPFWGGAVSAAQHVAFSYYDMPEQFAGRENPERFRSMVNLIWIGTAACPIAGNSDEAYAHNAMRAEEAEQVHLLHDLFGNPFQPLAVERSWSLWNNGTIRKLAQAIYDERAFDRMPELADAFQQGGCTNEEVLSHCRGPGPHVRGCWVVDLALGKK